MDRGLVSWRFTVINELRLMFWTPADKVVVVVERASLELM